MTKRWGHVRRLLLGIPPGEIGFSRRGFRGASEPMRARLEQVGATFLAGYHAALEQSYLRDLERELNFTPLELRGFAFEGAAMGLALLDALTPWRAARITRFLQGPGGAHAYMAHVGAGWVWARMPFCRKRSRRRLDPLLQWLAFDGWGFHEGFFHWRKYVAGQSPRVRFAGYEQRAFNQGLGRSWWFVNGGNPVLIAEMISPFPAQTQADMWSGIGLAATYAGMVGAGELADLRARAGAHWPQLAQGSAFAAKARERAGNLTAYTTLATESLCGISAREAAHLCDQTLENLPATGPEPAYEIWRRRIQEHFDSVASGKDYAGNSKLQAPSSRETPNPKLQSGPVTGSSRRNGFIASMLPGKARARMLALGAWCFSGAWSLEFGASKSQFIPATRPKETNA